MSRFTYTAIDARGAEKSGQLDAPDARQAVVILRGQGLFPTFVAVADRDAKVERDLPPAPHSTGSGLWRTGRARSEPARRSGSAVSQAAGTAQAADRTLLWTPRLPFVRVVGPKELALFTRQLATLLRAGLQAVLAGETTAEEVARYT